MRRHLAEFIGTFILMFAGTSAIVVNDLGHGTVTHVGIALVFGLVVAAMIYTPGDSPVRLSIRRPPSPSGWHAAFRRASCGPTSAARLPARSLPVSSVSQRPIIVPRDVVTAQRLEHDVLCSAANTHYNPLNGVSRSDPECEHDNSQQFRAHGCP